MFKHLIFFLYYHYYWLLLLLSVKRKGSYILLVPSSEVFFFVLNDVWNRPEKHFGRSQLQSGVRRAASSLWLSARNVRLEPKPRSALVINPPLRRSQDFVWIVHFYISDHDRWHISIFKNIFVTICIVALQCCFVVSLGRSISICKRGQAVINGAGSHWPGEAMSHSDAAEQDDRGSVRECVLCWKKTQTENFSPAFLFSIHYNCGCAPVVMVFI